MRDAAGSAATPAARCRKFRRGSFIASLSECRRRDASFRFDVGRPDHLSPLLGFFGNERPEIARRATEDNAAQVGELSLQLGIGEAGIDLLVELLDNLRGVSLGTTIRTSLSPRNLARAFYATFGRLR